MHKNEQHIRFALAQEMSLTAKQLLGSLSDQQRKHAFWPDFPNDLERKRWFYTPTDHGGLTLNNMLVGQQGYAMALVATGLSDAGFATASTIIGLENILAHIEGHHVVHSSYRARDPSRYYVRIFGDPSGDNWGWRFGGHHVSINHTIVNKQLVAGTPIFFGADPAVTPLLGGHMLNPLGGGEDIARDLMSQFDEAQRAIAIVSPAPPADITTTNLPSINTKKPVEMQRLSEVWRDALHPQQAQGLDNMQRMVEQQVGFRQQYRHALAFDAHKPIGLVAHAMSHIQQDILRQLINQYIARLPDAIADIELAKIHGEHFASLHFAWAGSTKAGNALYYRIQGEHLVIEFDKTQRDGNHIHSVWRDPTNDFGDDILAQHYATSHSHTPHDHTH